MAQEITYYCSFCDKQETVIAPTTFTTKYDGDEEDAFCPDHAEAVKFLHDQCPGCVSGWGECGLFMAVGNKAVTDNDLTAIRAGSCPYRTNGTLSFSGGQMKRLNISTKSEAGEAFAAAVTGE